MWKHRDFLVKAMISSYLEYYVYIIVKCKYIVPCPIRQECYILFWWYLVNLIESLINGYPVK